MYRYLWTLQIYPPQPRTGTFSPMYVIHTCTERSWTKVEDRGRHHSLDVEDVYRRQWNWPGDTAKDAHDKGMELKCVFIIRVNTRYGQWGLLKFARPIWCFLNKNYTKGDIFLKQRIYLLLFTCSSSCQYEFELRYKCKWLNTKNKVYLMTLTNLQECVTLCLISSLYNFETLSRRLFVLWIPLTVWLNHWPVTWWTNLWWLVHPR